MTRYPTRHPPCSPKKKAGAGNKINTRREVEDELLRLHSILQRVTGLSTGGVVVSLKAAPVTKSNGAGAHPRLYCNVNPGFSSPGRLMFQALAPPTADVSETPNLPLAAGMEYTGYR